MAYSIESTTAQRCTTNLIGQQCGLAGHHVGDHVTPDGRQRWSQSIFAPLAEAWGGRIGSLTPAGHVSEHAASVLSDRISAVAQRVESETPLREALASRLDALAEQLAAECKAREALAVELVNTRRSRLSPLEDRVVKLELPYGHIQAVKDTHNALVERIERIERDLRDTHNLAERAATAHLERKPDHWDADSDEPPRGQKYTDAAGARWRFRDFCGWQFKQKHDNRGWTSGVNDGDGGWIWVQLIDGRAAAAGVRPDFPWTVWNG